MRRREEQPTLFFFCMLLGNNLWSLRAANTSDLVLLPFHSKECTSSSPSIWPSWLKFFITIHLFTCTLSFSLFFLLHHPPPCCHSAHWIDVLPFLPAHFSSPDLLRRRVSSQLISALLSSIRRRVTEKKDDPKGRIWTCNATVHLSPFSLPSAPLPRACSVPLINTLLTWPPWHHSMLQTHHTGSLCWVLHPSAEPSQLQDDRMHTFCVSSFLLCFLQCQQCTRRYSFTHQLIQTYIQPLIHNCVYLLEAEKGWNLGQTCLSQL